MDGNPGQWLRLPDVLLLPNPVFALPEMLFDNSSTIHVPAPGQRYFAAVLWVLLPYRFDRYASKELSVE